MSSNFGSLSYVSESRSWAGFDFETGSQTFEFSDYMGNLLRYLFKLLEDSGWQVSSIKVSAQVASGNASNSLERMARVHLSKEKEQCYFYIFSEKEESSKKWRMTGKSLLMQGKPQMPDTANIFCFLEKY